MTSDERSGRDESDEERLDRKWEDLLQELRVMQTGAQLTAGFLLTLPFQQSFAKLTSFQNDLYLVLVVLAALVTALVMTPVAVHRRLSGEHVKERLVVTAHWLVHGVLACIALLITGMAVLIFDVVTDRSLSLTVGAALAALLVGLLVVLPFLLTRDKD
jgi:fumarate reductase subunit C